MKIAQKFKRLLKNLQYLSNIDLQKSGSCDSGKFDTKQVIKNVLYYVPNSSMARPNILGIEQTIELLLKDSKKSVVRFGDGEIELMFGGAAVFQKADKTLMSRLQAVFTSHNKDLLVCVPKFYFYPYYNPSQNEYNTDWDMILMPSYRERLNPLIDYSVVYGDTSISFMHLAGSRIEVEHLFNKIKKLWDGRNVVLVGCVQARKKYKYNLFENAATQDWVSVPNTNAFDQYQEIFERIKGYPKTSLIILMAGPTSKILAYDLFMDGYRALDLGHLAKSYDFFMNGYDFTSEKNKDFWMPDV